MLLDLVRLAFVLRLDLLALKDEDGWYRRYAVETFAWLRLLPACDAPVWSKSNSACLAHLAKPQ